MCKIPETFGITIPYTEDVREDGDGTDGMIVSGNPPDYDFSIHRLYMR